MRRLISAAALVTSDAKRDMRAASTSASGNVSATLATGCPLWSSTAAAADEKPGVISPCSVA